MSVLLGSNKGPRCKIDSTKVHSTEMDVDASWQKTFVSAPHFCVQPFVFRPDAVGSQTTLQGGSTLNSSLDKVRLTCDQKYTEEKREGPKLHCLPRRVHVCRRRSGSGFLGVKGSLSSDSDLDPPYSFEVELKKAENSFGNHQHFLFERQTFGNVWLAREQQDSNFGRVQFTNQNQKILSTDWLATCQNQSRDKIVWFWFVNRTRPWC